MPQSHRYPPEFRQQMVELVRAGRTPAELSREFEPSSQTIRNWVRQADRARGDAPTESPAPSETSCGACAGKTSACVRSGRFCQEPPAGSLGRPIRGRRGLRIRERLPGAVSHRHPVPRPGRLRQRVLCVAPSSALGALRVRCPVEGPSSAAARRRAPPVATGTRRRRPTWSTATSPLPVQTRCGWRISPTCRRGPACCIWPWSWTPGSRRVVGWAMAGHLRTELVVQALDMALGQRRPEEVIHHSDQGGQYSSLAFGRRCREAGVRPSRGSVGDCYDNALCESFFATLECELIDRRCFPDACGGPPRDLRLHRVLVQPASPSLGPQLRIADELRTRSCPAQVA